MEYTEAEMVQSWKAHDFDNSGGVTKDELIHARKMKKDYFAQKTKDSDAKQVAPVAPSLTAELTKVFAEDHTNFLTMPGEVVNMYLINKLSWYLGCYTEEELLCPKPNLKKAFDKADANHDGQLNFDEYKVFQKNREVYMKGKYGGCYEMKDEQIKARHCAYDFNKNGQISFDELKGVFKLKYKWFQDRYPKEASAEFKELWDAEIALCNGLGEEILAKGKELSDQEKTTPDKGYKWRLELFDIADANKDGHLDFEEWKVYFKKFEERATEKTGGSFTLSDEHLEKSWKLTDFDNSGGVTKDELIHARKMKKCYKK